MLVEQRHQFILRELERNGSVSVTEMARELGVSTVTLRHDVRELAVRGLLRRVHGGAIPLEAASRPAPASHESGGERYALGMLVPASRLPYYFPDIIRGAQEAARARGVRIAVAFSRENADEDRGQLAQLQKAGVDGVMLSPASHPASSPETERWINELDLPVVLVERLAGLATRAEQVASDHARGAYLAVAHLASLGRRRIGLLSQQTPTHPRLLAGFEQAIHDHGLEPAPLHVVPAGDDHDTDAVDAQVARYLDTVTSAGVDALLVHNDRNAISLVRTALARGISVPGDLAVVSYDDEVASLADVPLTAVSPPRHAVGATAVNMLIDRLDGSDEPERRLLLAPRLVIRESCGARQASGPNRS